MLELGLPEVSSVLNNICYISQGIKKIKHFGTPVANSTGVKSRGDYVVPQFSFLFIVVLLGLSTVN